MDSLANKLHTVATMYLPAQPKLTSGLGFTSQPLVFGVSSIDRFEKRNSGCLWRLLTIKTS